MLRILKAELLYSKFWIIRVVGFIPLLIFYFYLLNRWWMNGVIILTSLFVVVVNLKIRFKEERLRKEILLPVSNRQIAFVRLIYTIVPVIFVYGLCEIINLVPAALWKSWQNSGAERFMFFGLTLSLLLTYHVISDMAAGVSYKRTKLMELIKLLIAGIIFVIGAGAVTAGYKHSKSAGLNMIKFIFLLDFIFAWISIHTFNIRKSFFNN